VEWGVLVLWNLLDLTVELGSGGLVHAAGLGQTAKSDGFEDAENAGSVDVASELGGVETYLDVALSGKVVDLSRANLAHDLHDAHGVAKISVVEMEIGASLDMCDSLAEVDRGASYRAMDVITFFEKELCKV